MTMKDGTGLVNGDLWASRLRSALTCGAFHTIVVHRCYRWLRPAAQQPSRCMYGGGWSSLY